MMSVARGLAFINCIVMKNVYRLTTFLQLEDRAFSCQNNSKKLDPCHEMSIFYSVFEREYKYLSCVYGVDRKICHEGH